MLIIASLIVTRRLKQIPTGPQVILETGIGFLNNFGKNQFGHFNKYLSSYIGSLFLFILTASIIGILSPSAITAFGREFLPPFVLKPPTKDINVTAALAIMSVTLVLVCGFAARGVSGWFKHLLHPLPVMLPFNIMEYAIKVFSLALRLFGNILGGYVMMHMITGLLPVALPMVFALYFDLFDGAIQANIFVFLTSLYIAEAVKVHED
jgi:F-type H+-transporting ATPase subunit a